MPLRTRLVILLVLFVAVALVATDAITFTSLKTSLTSQVDQQLSQISRSTVGCNGVPYGTYFNQYATNGQSVMPVTSGFSCERRAPLPEISAGLVRQAVAVGGMYTTVGSSGSSTHYRVLIELLSTPQTGSTVLAVGIPLTGVSATLGHQFRLDLTVSIIVLIGLAIGAWALIRLSMQPLERMSKTAGEIAAGDLARRVAPADDRTEVGQLGAALNVMLTRIEEAFAEREASEARLRRFVADASHELRTPLTSIRGYAELFRSGLAERPEDLAAALQRIESEASRMGVLVEDLLLLARLDQGRPLAPAVVNLAALAADAVSDAGAVDPSRNVVARVPPELVVVADEQRLRQLFGNLVNNALAHTPAGSPIEIEASKAPAGVRVAVVDHGPGISIADMPHVFERFWRADQSRRRKAGGSGLGLAIVAALVSAHRGRVWVEETPGGGATFVVELPLSGEPPPEAATSRPSFGSRGEVQPGGRDAPPAVPSPADRPPADALPADAPPADAPPADRPPAGRPADGTVEAPSPVSPSPG